MELLFIRLGNGLTAWFKKNSYDVFFLQESMAKSNCHRIYVTRVHKDFECDVFMPPIDLAKYHLVR